MRTTIVFTLILGLIFLNCNQSRSTTKAIIEQTENLQQVDNSKDKEEIQNLIRQVLNWGWSGSTNIILKPALTDSSNSIYIGFDLNELESNLDKLRATGFFANEFIENYNQIILTLDKKLRNHEFGEWLFNDLPPYRFANGTNPWCDCQDTPYDNPNPWDFVEITIIELNNDSAQLAWKWGLIDYDNNYKFRAVKENGKWKIAYLQEFDFDVSTLKDGL